MSLHNSGPWQLAPTSEYLARPDALQLAPPENPRGIIEFARPLPQKRLAPCTRAFTVVVPWLEVVPRTGEEAGAVIWADSPPEGGNGNDILIGDNRANLFETVGGGSDLMDGRGGRDTIGASQGANGLCGGGSNPLVVDLARGKARYIVAFRSSVRLISIENAHGAWDDDTLRGDEGRNRLAGGGGDDVLRGRGDDDRLLGGRHADDLDGGAGSNRNDGGPGSDRCVRPSTARGAMNCEAR